MTVTFTEKRKEALKKHLNVLMKIKLPKIRYVAKVIGHIISALPASEYGVLHYRKLKEIKR